jgi:DNA helicase-2/ATP-dependent DNA helicase PcrA
MARYRELLREAEALDYDALEVVALDLLRRDDVSAGLRQRWMHVLVDEYQDTSLLQQEILDTLGPANLFVVGDHAQSIYAFRGAHVEGFASAAESAQVLELSVNWRSVAGVVEIANRCSRAMEIPGLEMTCARGGGFEDNGVARLDAPDREALFEAIAQDVAASKPEGGSWSDMAVLSPTWDLLERLSEVLATHEIPHEVARKRLDVWESEEARWLVSCLRAAINPHDPLALRSALLSFTPRVTPGEWAGMRASAASGLPSSHKPHDEYAMHITPGS